MVRAATGQAGITFLTGKTSWNHRRQKTFWHLNHNMRQATKGHAGCACAGKRDFVSRKTPKRSHFSQKNGRIWGVFRIAGRWTSGGRSFSADRSGSEDHEVRSNPCLMPICRATHYFKSIPNIKKRSCPSLLPEQERFFNFQMFPADFPCSLSW